MGRRSKNIAKLEIYEVFRRFIGSGVQKVTVSGLIEETGMNRKTFYNHFSSQDELAAWGYRFDLANALKADNEEADLIYLDSDPYGFHDLPCYTRNPSSTFSLDQTRFIESFNKPFSDHEPYYHALFRSAYGEPLCRYLVEMLQQLLLEDIEYFLKGRKMPMEAKTYIASLFAEGIVRQTVDSLIYDAIAWAKISTIAPINNLVHESMLHLVEAYQAERSSTYFSKLRTL